MSRKVRPRTAIASSFYIFDAWRGVCFQLPAAFAQQKLNCPKVSLVNDHVFFKLVAIAFMRTRP